MALAGTGFLLSAGCPVMEEIGDPQATIYGRFKGDIAFDSDQTNSNGNFVQWVSNEGGGDQMALTVRETRVGIDLTMGESITGNVEVDFFGGSAMGTATVIDDTTGNPETGTAATSPPENKPTVLVRHVYAKMDLGNGMSLLAGQTSDIFSPIAPSILNYVAGWYCGNTGYRRPQLRFECAVGETGVLTQASIGRSVGGETSASADFQGRVGYTIKDDMDNGKLTVGASGLYGFSDDDRDLQVSGFAIDGKGSIGKLVVSGEYFTGMNMSAYLDGIGQGTDSVSGEIEAKGGWFQVGYAATENFTASIGFGYDDPQRKDLGSAATDDQKRDRNQSVFVTLRMQLNPKTEAAIEYSKWTTTYFDGTGNKEFENNRVQASLIFLF
jgi:hypothetical protein